jgi:hypothetical protein
MSALVVPSQQYELLWAEDLERVEALPSVTQSLKISQFSPFPLSVHPRSWNHTQVHYQDRLSTLKMCYRDRVTLINHGELLNVLVTFYFLTHY